MGTTLSVTFPLGRYHATRWDGGANTSDAEWPPSPWRVLRALVAVWYSRWPDLPAVEIDALLDELGENPAYHTPPARPGTTRHYMPDIAYSTATTGNTDQVIDAFLAVPPDQPLLIHWNRDLSPQARGTLAKLAEQLPYLGRSESICDARLSDDDHVPDASWWRLGVAGPGTERVELLAPDGPVSRTRLEASTVETRRARRLIPAGSHWVSYGRQPPASEEHSAVPEWTINAFRFELSSAVPVRARNAILAAEAMHGLITRILTRAGTSAEVAGIIGVDADGGPKRGTHDHLHIVPLTRESSHMFRANQSIGSLVVWLPTPLSEELAGLVADQARMLRTQDRLTDSMPQQYLLVAGSGQVQEVAPEITEASRTWVSAMPYLPVRHRKKNQPDDAFLTQDVTFECGYRNLPKPVQVERLEGAHLVGEIAQFRRRRACERMNRQRRGTYLRLSFAEPVEGPLVLGQLSHFGFGSFVPD